MFLERARAPTHCGGYFKTPQYVVERGARPVVSIHMRQGTAGEYDIWNMTVEDKIFKLWQNIRFAATADKASECMGSLYLM